MSVVASPTSSIHRDIRSASQPSKRDRDTASKWSTGVRALAGSTVPLSHQPSVALGEDPHQIVLQHGKIRPQKEFPVHKSRSNATPKPTFHPSYDTMAPARLTRKANAAQEAHDHTSTPLSKSLLDLLPTHVNNTNASITTAMGDEGVLYSFDKGISSPGQKGRAVDLGGLVDQAEKKFLADQVDRMVKGEYEVIDAQGETTILGSKKGKKSPRQKAKTEGVVACKLDDDDGFELV